MKYKLSELVSFKTGKLNSNAAVLNGKYPFFTCSQETYLTNTYSFDCECCLLGGNNANGVYPLKYYNGKFDAYQRTYIIQTKNEHIVQNKYIYYALLLMLEELKSMSTGAATKFLTLTILNNLEINVPFIKKQEKIIKVLSNYDDLIENNNKRIKILEEMAQKIYKEWFVDFKYPGHETTTFKDTELGKLVMPKKGKNITKATIKEGNIPVVAGGLEPAYYHNVANTAAPIVTVSASGANAGYVKLYYEDIWASDCSYIDNSMTPYVYYFYLYLKYNQIRVTNLQKGAAQPHVYPQDLATLKIRNIDKNAIKQFNLMVTPLFEEIKNIVLKNKILKQTRDLLLPRLMSSEIDIDKLEIV